MFQNKIDKGNILSTIANTAWNFGNVEMLVFLLMCNLMLLS